MYFQQYALFLVFSAFTASAEDSYARWSDVLKNSTVDSLPSCARSCVVDIDKYLSCWSYGCVCSERTTGTNLKTGVQHIQDCANNCSSSTSSDTNRALGLVQSLCSATFISVATVAPTASISGSAAANVSATRTTATSTSSATSTALFDASRVIKIDTPGDLYDRLKNPCLRWVLNGCQSSRDNKNGATCTSVNTTPAWNGTGMFLRCDTPDCLCSISTNFDRTVQTVYDQANRYCGISAPTEEQPNNTDFSELVQMISQYCSTSGTVVKQWTVKLIGSPHHGGSSDLGLALGVGLGLGIPSLILALFMAVIAYKALRFSTSSE